jgi:NTP pyrophosphatase (non-canonical NTP hydrolase)
MGRSSEKRAAEFAAAVVAERARQDAKWGARADHSLAFWLAILLEEVGECARAVLERDHANLARELVQVAAVCQRIFEANDSLYGVTLAEPPTDGGEGDLTPEVAKASAWCFGFGTSLCPEARHVATGALANAQGWSWVGVRWRCPSCQVAVRDSICPAEALKAPAVCGGGHVSKPCPDGREMATGAEAGDAGWRWERGAWMCPDCDRELPF